MLKVKNVRNVAMMGVPLFLLCGCSNGDVAITPIDNDHHSMFVDDDGNQLEQININDLSNVGVYLVFDKNDENYKYDVRFLRYAKYDGYTEYINEMTGDVYSVSIDNPTIGDKHEYTLTEDKDMYYIENVSDEIYDYKYSDYILSDEIDLTYDTISPKVLKLLYADYIAHNSNEVFELAKQHKNK